MKRLLVGIALSAPLYAQSAIISYTSETNIVRIPYDPPGYLEEPALFQMILDTDNQQVLEFNVISAFFNVSLTQPGTSYSLYSEYVKYYDVMSWQMRLSAKVNITMPDGTELVGSGSIEAAPYEWWAPINEDPFQFFDRDDASVFHIFTDTDTDAIYSIDFANTQIEVLPPRTVPEPSTIALLGLGIVGLWSRRQLS